MTSEYEDYIPKRVPIARTARAFKILLERLAKRAYQYMRDFEHNDDDPDYHKYSAFFANAGGVGDYARDVVRDWPEIDTK